jgi:hypothetical protein
MKFQMLPVQIKVECVVCAINMQRQASGALWYNFRIHFSTEARRQHKTVCKQQLFLNSNYPLAAQAAEEARGPLFALCAAYGAPEPSRRLAQQRRGRRKRRRYFDPVLNAPFSLSRTILVP